MTALKGSVLLFRFLLELAALAAVAYWGWHVSDGPVRYVAAIVTPIAFATALAISFLTIGAAAFGVNSRSWSASAASRPRTRLAMIRALRGLMR